MSFISGVVSHKIPKFVANASQVLGVFVGRHGVTAVAPRKKRRANGSPADSPLRRRVLLIYNPTAGVASARRLGRVVKILLTMGAVVTVRRTARRGDAEAFAAEATRDAYDVVAVAGGDGTVNEAINGLAGSDLPLAVIPLGTANVLAAEIAMPRRARDRARLILNARGRPVCVGVANERAFIMMAGAGFDAYLVAHVNPCLKRCLGRLAYVVEGARAMARFAYPRYRVTVDGAAFEATSVIVANGHYYGGRFICAPRACLDDPTFEVCLFLGSGPVNVLRYAVTLARGRLERLPDFRIVRGSEIFIARADGVAGLEPAQIDGDIGCRLPLAIRPAKRRLTLLCGEAVEKT